MKLYLSVVFDLIFFSAIFFNSQVHYLIMREKIFITSIGNSRNYMDTDYIFALSETNSSIPYRHWYSSYALLTHLVGELNWKPKRIFILYPETYEGRKSYYEGWNEKKRESIKDLLQKFCDDDLDEIEVPNIKNDRDIWKFLNILTEKLRDIEDGSIIMDITHGFRLYQSLLFSLTYYFENISQDRLKLEKIYYASYESTKKSSQFIELDQLIMLQQDISRIKLFLRNLDISAFDSANYNENILKDYLKPTQRIVFFINNGVVNNDLLDEINNLESRLNDSKSESEGKDQFYVESFINNIIPEIIKIREEIFSENQETAIWKRQINLAKLLLNRKLDISKSLQLIREAIISWLCEEILGIHALSIDNRKKADEILIKLKKRGRTNRTLLSLIDYQYKKRNQFSHVFTTNNQVQALKDYSNDLLNFKRKLIQNFLNLESHFESRTNIEQLKTIVTNL